MWNLVKFTPAETALDIWACITKAPWIGNVLFGETTKQGTSVIILRIENNFWPPDDRVFDDFFFSVSEKNRKKWTSSSKNYAMVKTKSTNVPLFAKFEGILFSEWFCTSDIITCSQTSLYRCSSALELTSTWLRHYPLQKTSS